MNFTALLDTAIGLTIVYLGAALFVTVTNESIAAVLNSRGKMLYQNVRALLGQPYLNQVIKLIPGFKGAEKSLRSYVDPEVLAHVVVGKWLTPNVDLPQPAQKPDLFAAIRKMADEEGSELKSVLWTLAVSADNNIEKLTKNVSQWIDRSLTVLGEGYKRRMQLWSFVLGILVAGGFNVDTLHVTERLYRDKELRESVAVGAEQFTQKTSAEVFKQCQEKSQAEREKTEACGPMVNLAGALAKRSDTFGKLPIGWEGVALRAAPGESAWRTVGIWALRLLGWLLTALAVSVGAPFWFDLLNRFVNIRSSIKRPEVAKEQK